MGNGTEALAQQFYEKATVEECSAEELRHTIKRYPYFAPAQFLLVQKLRTSPEEMSKQKAKAILFYPDPLLFENFINNDRVVGKEVFASKATVQQEIVVAPPPEIIIIEEGNDIAVELIPVAREEPVIESLEANTAVHQNFEDQLPKAENNAVTIQSEAALVIETFEEPAVIHKDEEATINKDSEQHQLDMVVPTIETGFTFEPFHAVDYFASQGIKISPDDVAKDKLGKQLKSFTEWLRTMKRLPATINDAAENTAEKKVETLASHSVADSTVVTEAMADVWIKQGNREKALDIYNKLSLLAPSKKAYFAAKIDQLKTS